MKTKDEIENIFNNLPEPDVTNFPGMSYEQGIEEALDWVLENISDDEFEYT